MIKTLLCLGVALVTTSGCYAEATYHPLRPVTTVGYVRPVAAPMGPSPSMAYVSPGVQVVTGHDYPVFYSDGAYWRYDNGLWYRSSYWNRGWVGYNNVPMSVRGISQPWTYRNYRGNGVVDHRSHAQQPAYRTQQPAYRTQQPAHRTAPQPAIRTAPPTPAYRSPPPQARSQPVRSSPPPTRRR